MKSKIIWHLISNRWNSAITEYALSTARALEIRSHKNIVTGIKGLAADNRSKELGVKTFAVEDFSLKTLKTLRDYAKKLNPDVIFLYGGNETFLAKFLQKKICVRFFGQELNTRLSFLNAFSYSHVDRFLVPNSFLFKEVADLAINKPLKKVLLGLKTHSVKEEARNNEIILLGRLDAVKGHEIIIRIFSKMLKHFSNEKPLLHIIGQDANLSADDIKLFAEKNNLKLGSDLILTNQRVHDIDQYLKNATMGLISSLGSEQICRVAEEFLLLGTPIFVSGAGATEEVLFKGAGETYKGLSEEEIALQWKDFFLRSVNECSEIREERASKAKELFSLESMGEALEDFIFE